MIQCIKCQEEHEGDHVCIDERTIEELFDQSLIEVRARMPKVARYGPCCPPGHCHEGHSDSLKCDKWKPKVTVPPGQDPEDDEFKP